MSYQTWALLWACSHDRRSQDFLLGGQTTNHIGEDQKKVFTVLQYLGFFIGGGAAT